MKTSELMDGHNSCPWEFQQTSGKHDHQRLRILHNSIWMDKQPRIFFLERRGITYINVGIKRRLIYFGQAQRPDNDTPGGKSR
jgi:hypothetical protein